MQAREDFEKMLASQIDIPMEDKKGLAVIWLADGQPIGHNNVNQVNFEVDAKMHLHIWESENPKKGWGVALLRLSIPMLFQRLELQNIICEPYAFKSCAN